MQTPSDIAKKIKSFSHGEFNRSNFTDEKNIEVKIANNEDIFERGFRLEKINIDESYPEFIRNNKNLLKQWII